jgi:hypothetical protein
LSVPWAAFGVPQRGGNPIMEAAPILAIPAAVPLAAAELFVAAVLGWIGLNLHKTAGDPKAPPIAGVLLDLSLGLVAVTALVFFFSASLKVFFWHRKAASAPLPGR